MLRIAATTSALLLFALGCSDPPSKSNADPNTNNATNGTTNNVDGSACEEAAATYGELYDEFPRDCQTYADCAWFDGLASCGCPGLGSVGADRQEIDDAEDRVSMLCAEEEAVRGAFTCLNSVVCTHEPLESGGWHALACEQGTCATVEATISEVTIEPATITLAETGMTDEFFTISVETSGLIDIAVDGVHAWLEDGRIASDPVDASVEDGTVTLTISYSWASNLEPGEYDVGVEVPAGNGTVALSRATTLTIEM